MVLNPLRCFMVKSCKYHQTCPWVLAWKYVQNTLSWPKKKKILHSGWWSTVVTSNFLGPRFCSIQISAAHFRATHSLLRNMLDACAWAGSARGCVVIFGIFPRKKKISSKSFSKMDYGGKAGDYSAQDPSTGYSGKLRNQIVVLPRWKRSPMLVNVCSCTNSIFVIQSYLHLVPV